VGRVREVAVEHEVLAVAAVRDVREAVRQRARDDVGRAERAEALGERIRDVAEDGAAVEVVEAGHGPGLRAGAQPQGPHDAARGRAARLAGGERTRELGRLVGRDEAAGLAGPGPQGLEAAVVAHAERGHQRGDAGDAAHGAAKFFRAASGRLRAAASARKMPEV
jgi:hypothetical protein